MSPSLRALLDQLIDYAGLFPPARLPLDQAIRNYARYRREADSWMLNAFVCPAARLAELDALGDELFGSDPPFVFSALGRGGDGAPEFLANLRTDLNDIAAFRRRHGERVKVYLLEVRVPPEVVAPSATQALAGQLLSAIRRIPGSDSLAFLFEVPAGKEWGNVVGRMLDSGVDLARPSGYKLRTGGLEASAFPSAEVVALALSTCLKGGVRFKATAGLHHPFPKFDSTVQATMHGFVNLFAAAALGHARRLGPAEVQAILEDADPAHFAFTEEGLRWRGLEVSTAEIEFARTVAVMPFGSCSFDEPRDDLRALGWL